MGSKIRPIALVLIAPVIALVVGLTLALTSAQADSHLTAVFTGSATTGQGQAYPIEIDTNDVTTRADGAVGFAYTYGAAGQVSGDVAGHFTYKEEGRIYFMNPSDPTTMVGSDLYSSEFSVLPSDPSKHVFTIYDTCSSCYDHGHETSGLSTLPTWARDFAVRSLVSGSSSDLASNPELDYGYFTFTDSYGTFTGYATPNFSQFAIELEFDTAGTALNG